MYQPRKSGNKWASYPVPEYDILANVKIESTAVGKREGIDGRIVGNSTDTMQLEGPVFIGTECILIAHHLKSIHTNELIITHPKPPRYSYQETS